MSDDFIINSQDGSYGAAAGAGRAGGGETIGRSGRPRGSDGRGVEQVRAAAGRREEKTGGQSNRGGWVNGAWQWVGLVLIRSYVVT